MGRKKTRRTPKTQRKREKIKPDRRNPITRKPIKKRAPTPEERLVNEALRESPDMTAMLDEHGGELYVPPDYPVNNEGASAAASSQSRQKYNVHEHLKKLDRKYGKWAAGEEALSALNRNLSLRPPTPVVSFGDYMKQQEAATEREKQNELFLNNFAGTTFDPKKYKNDFTFSFPGGKRKSRRRRKKSRRRRKKSRRRKTKRKSRRRRK
tara:strand:+ start:501 stop:1127 length:627 start_codon:yes stop_codon:yes gene_type:complete